MTEEREVEAGLAEAGLAEAGLAGLTYWDLDEKDRARLTSEEIERYKKIHLMEQGIVLPPIPQTPALTQVTMPQQKRFWEVKTPGKYSSSTICYFDNSEAAQAFLMLKPFKSDYSYDMGSEYAYFSRSEPLTINECMLYDQDDLANVREMIAANKKLRESYTKAKEEYDKAFHDAAKAVAGLVEDWQEQYREAMRLERIAVVYSEYLETCEDNHAIALKFLRKAYSDEDIKKSYEWSPSHWPVGFGLEVLVPRPSGEETLPPEDEPIAQEPA